MGERLRGDLIRRLGNNPTESQETIADPLAIGTVLLRRDGKEDFIIEKINKRKGGKDPLVILRGPNRETISRARSDLERILAEENGTWSYKNPPKPPLS